MVRSFLLFLAITLSAQIASAQSRIVTVSGAIYTGTILNEDMREVLLRTSDSLDITIPREKIESLSYGRTSQHVTTTGAIEEPEGEWTDRPVRSRRPQPAHWAAGAAFGTPAGLQPVVGYYSGDWAVRGSAMIIPDAIIGLQLGLMRSIAQEGPFDLHLGLISGFSMIDGSYPDYTDYMWVYAGPAINAEVFGIYAELGLTLGVGDFSNPQFMYQIGYAYHFK